MKFFITSYIKVAPYRPYLSPINDAAFVEIHPPPVMSKVMSVTELPSFRN